MAENQPSYRVAADHHLFNLSRIVLALFLMITHGVIVYSIASYLINIYHNRTTSHHHWQYELLMMTLIIILPLLTSCTAARAIYLDIRKFRNNIAVSKRTLEFWYQIHFALFISEWLAMILLFLIARISLA